MDKIALSKRLAGFSEVFKQETKFARDLKAMSMVIENLPEEKFASLIIQAEEAKKDEKVEEEKEDMKESAKKIEEPKEEEAEKPEVEAAKEETIEEEAEEKEASGTFWSKEASQAVLSFLRKDVLGEDAPAKKASAEPVPGAKLPTAQTPDGKGNKPAPTLKKEQVPNIETVIKSDIVQKSHGTVRKEASAKAEGTMLHSEGVELTASMDEVELDSAEMQKLNQLFG